MEKKKVLIFVPYQDEDNFYSDGILTREFAMLNLFHDAGYQKIISVKKPRTVLDRKRYEIREERYPAGTIEHKVRKLLEGADTIQYLPFLSLSQLRKRRGWWPEGFTKTIALVEPLIDTEHNDYLIYSDNPYAASLLLHLKEKGCRLYFDVMDNFAIHPSLNQSERDTALALYQEIFQKADVISANSVQTCRFMSRYTDREIVLVKNGVFENNEVAGEAQLQQIRTIQQEKQGYSRCVGYIGKLGLRLDADLIDQVSAACPEVLFVFIGDCIRGQINSKLLNLFDTRKNILHLDGIPSAYVYAALNEFDILSIPHSVGKNENGGDPLKLYQYLTRKKPVITTPILGVEEFRDYLRISDAPQDWVEFIEHTPHQDDFAKVEEFTWNTRIKPVMEKLQ